MKIPSRNELNTAECWDLTPLYQNGFYKTDFENGKMTLTPYR